MDALDDSVTQRAKEITQANSENNTRFLITIIVLVSLATLFAIGGSVFIGITILAVNKYYSYYEIPL